MKTLVVSGLVCAMLITNTYLAWHFGAKSVNCPPCIESKACPSEEIWVNTSFGLMHFEAGEIDAKPPYILTKPDMDEMFHKIEMEILKQRGNAS